MGKRKAAAVVARGPGDVALELFRAGVAPDATLREIVTVNAAYPFERCMSLYTVDGLGVIVQTDTYQPGATIYRDGITVHTSVFSRFRDDWQLGKVDQFVYFQQS